MEEIEVKIIDVDRNSIVRRLLSMGAKKSFEGCIHAVSFDLPDKSIRHAARTLRLRKKGSRVYLTFKEPVNNKSAKIRHEYEVEVSDFSVMKKILEELNFKQWRDINKHRVSYRLGRLLFEFDKYKGEYSYIPEFMEIEVMGGSKHKNPVKLIHDFAAKLGYGPKDCRSWTLNDLVKHYRKR